MSVLVCIDIFNTGTIHVSAIEYIQNTDRQYRHNTDPIQRERIGMYWQFNTYQYKQTVTVMQIISVRFSLSITDSTTSTVQAWRSLKFSEPCRDS
jgi:hypothetical protein